MADVAANTIRQRRPPPLAMGSTVSHIGTVWTPAGTMSLKLADEARTAEVIWSKHAAAPSDAGFGGGVMYSAEKPYIWRGYQDLEVRVNSACWILSRQNAMTSNSGQCEMSANNMQARSSYYSTVLIVEKSLVELRVVAVVVHPKQSPKGSFSGTSNSNANLNVNNSSGSISYSVSGGPRSTTAADSQRYATTERIEQRENTFVCSFSISSSEEAASRQLGSLELHSPTRLTRTATCVGYGKVQYEGQVMRIMDWIRLMNEEKQALQQAAAVADRVYSER